jgi:hypothetical protein
MVDAYGSCGFASARDNRSNSLMGKGHPRIKSESTPEVGMPKNTVISQLSAEFTVRDFESEGQNETHSSTVRQD